MNALWNKKDLERPANNVWIASRKAIDYKRFLSALEIIIKDLDSQNTLHMEAAILSRLIYRMKSKFRNDKGLKNMEKVNRALLNYLEIDLLKEYQQLKDYVEADGLVINLPTKQMLEYVLVRTQGFAKLMCRIENVAKCSAEFLKARINIGHAWTVSVIAYAVVSRVWYLSRYLLKRCCAWYNSMFEYLEKFRAIGPPWLPKNYDLPSNLKTWLDLPWIDHATDSVPLKDDGKETIFSLIKAQIDDPCDLNIESGDVESPSKNFDDSINDFEKSSKEDKRILQDGSESSERKKEVIFLADDIGMSIDRRSFQSNFPPKPIHVPDEIQGKENSKRNSEGVPIELSSKQCRKKKSNALLAEDIVLPVPVKRRKKLKNTEEKGTAKVFGLDETNSANDEKDERLQNRGETEVDERKKCALKKSKLKLSKGAKKSVKINTQSSGQDKKRKTFILGDMKSRDELLAFLNKDSYPGLDRLQWNMLNNSVKKFVTKLEKCTPSDEKRQRILLKKINCQIRNWIK